MLCRFKVYDWNGVLITMILSNFYQIQVIQKVVIVHVFFPLPCFSTPMADSPLTQPMEWQAPREEQHSLYLAESDRLAETSLLFGFVWVFLQNEASQKKLTNTYPTNDYFKCGHPWFFGIYNFWKHVFECLLKEDLPFDPPLIKKQMRPYYFESQ